MNLQEFRRFLDSGSYNERYSKAGQDMWDSVWNKICVEFEHPGFPKSQVSWKSSGLTAVYHG